MIAVFLEGSGDGGDLQSVIARVEKLMGDREYGGAVQAARAGLIVYPDSEELLMQCAMGLYVLHEHMDDPEGCLGEAIELLSRAREGGRVPELVDLYGAMAYSRLARLQGDPSDTKGKSEELFRQAIKDDRGVNSGIAHAVFAEEFLARRGQFGEAEYHYSRALEEVVGHVAAVRDYTKMLLAHGRVSDARCVLRRFLADDCDRESQDWAHGLIRSLQGVDDSSLLMAEALEIDPSYEGARRALAKCQVDS